MADDEKKSSPPAQKRARLKSARGDDAIAHFSTPSRGLETLTPASSPQTSSRPKAARSSASEASSFRTNDEVLIFELGARHLQAGLAGEAGPRSTKCFGTKNQKIPGDHSQSLSEDLGSHGTVDQVEKWGDDHQLWPLDMRSADLGLAADKIEKAVREAILNDLLIVDTTSRQMVLVLPTLLPHPLLSTILITFFNLYPTPMSITLLPIPLTSAFAAGVRSALVIDIGWHETVVSAIYEYREILQKRSSRAMKLFGWEMNKLLRNKLNLFQSSEHDQKNATVSFDDTEEVLVRMAWCKSIPSSDTHPQQAPGPAPDTSVTIPLRSLPSGTSRNLNIPFSHFSNPAETTFFADCSPLKHHDSHELPLPFLAYTALLALSPDTRQSCLSRVIITGGGSNIPGLKGRLVDEIKELCATRGWDKVHNYGSLKGPPKRRMTVRNPEPVSEQKQHPIKDTSKSGAPGPHISATNDKNDDDDATITPAHLLPQINDRAILTALRTRTIPSLPSHSCAAPTTSTSTTPNPTRPAPPFRVLRTLGPWSGASLLCGLKLDGAVEIKREDFFRHGLAGADATGRKGEGVSVEASTMWRLARLTLAGAGTGMGGGEKEGRAWSLGAWG